MRDLISDLRARAWAGWSWWGADRRSKYLSFIHPDPQLRGDAFNSPSLISIETNLKKDTHSSLNLLNNKKSNQIKSKFVKLSKQDDISFSYFGSRTRGDHALELYALDRFIMLLICPEKLTRWWGFCESKVCFDSYAFTSAEPAGCMDLEQPLRLDTDTLW